MSYRCLFEFPKILEMALFIKLSIDELIINKCNIIIISYVYLAFLYIILITYKMYLQNFIRE